MELRKKRRRVGVYYHLDPQNMPKHIAIIMDGNRRWAKKRGLSPTDGHRAGVETLAKIVDHCRKLGIGYLTVYALSTENWRKRAKEEVKGIFDLLIRLVREKKKEFRKKGIKFFVLGNFQEFPRRVRRAIEEMLTLTVRNYKLRFNVALNYGGRDEIVRAVRRIVEDKIPSKKIDERLITKYLYTNGQPDPDLIIRTGGEIRISNFLLWQLSYSELYFTDVLWPDFGPRQLEKAIKEFQKRERRFGGDSPSKRQIGAIKIRAAFSKKKS